MSEYQYVAFRAIDGPVSKKNLEYMRRQSSRAEITPWSFENEYQFGDFGGNAEEMLRRGYDIHLHYANFGTRTLLIRLPHGWPNSSAAKPYLRDDSLAYEKDKQGPGGILRIEPSFEPGQLNDLWDLDELLDRLVPLRAEILDGDLRPLYLAHLAVASDLDHDPEEMLETPVPAGLKKLSKAQQALAELYGVTPSLLAVAARHSPPLSDANSAHNSHRDWLGRQPEATKDAWLARLMADSEARIGQEVLEQFHQAHPASAWPTVIVGRSVAALKLAADERAREAKRQAEIKADKLRAKRFARMAADPELTLRETEKIVEHHRADGYEQIATLLADLRTALVGSGKADLAQRQAEKLRKKYPKLRMLTSELRRKGLLPK